MDSDKNRHNFSSLLLIVTVFAFGLVFLRFSQIMVHGEIDGEDLEENVEQLYTSNHTLQADRGTIYDRHGNPLAIDATSYKMIGVLTDKWSTETNPQHVQDKDAVSDVLSKHLNLSKEEILEYLNKDVDQVEFGSAGNSLSNHTVTNIKNDLEEQELTGIIFDERQKRLYPNGIFSSHTIGLAQYSNEEDAENQKQLQGVMGLEATFDDLLTGQNGQRTFQKDSFGYLVPGLENEEVQPQDGGDLYLSFDHKLQVHLETILSEVQEENNPKAMTATVMDPETGEIIASAQRPSFNATTLENIDESWQNLMTEYMYEPGSTMKVLTLAAAIEEGVFNPNQYFESGTTRLHGGVVRDYNPEGWGWISQLEGVARSSNVLFVQLVDAMGHDVWKEYLDGFGFGQTTGVSLPNEQAGYNPFEWPLQRVNTGFGQGISVTPIQMLQAFSAVANGGEMVKPKFIEKTVSNETDEETIYKPVKKESPISEETANLTLNYLKQATEMEDAVAGPYQKEGVNIAAKTGTAQMVDPETGSYSSSKYIYSVTGMIPADDPEYLVYITVQEPNYTEDATHGSAVVQKIYHPLVDRILDFNENAPTESSQDNIQYTNAPSYLDMSADEAVNSLNENGQNYTLVGTGSEIVQQFPYPDTPLFDNQQIILMTNGAATMPDLTNWSRNDALKVAELTGVNMVFEGEGYVVEQSLPAGSYMDPGEEITLTLSSEVNEEG
jgi:penicillin-binding protein 2B